MLTLNLWQQSPRFSPWEWDLQNHLPILIHRMVRPQIHFCCYVNTKPMTVIFSFLPVKTRLFPKFHYKLDACWHLQKTSITYFWSLVASQSVMSLRPLNQQTAKSQPRALLTFTKDRSRYSSTFTKDEYHQILKLGGVSIGYVIATSEPTDS